MLQHRQTLNVLPLSLQDVLSGRQLAKLAKTDYREDDDDDNGDQQGEEPDYPDMQTQEGAESFFVSSLCFTCVLPLLYGCCTC